MPLTLPAAAPAAPYMVSVMQDDNQLVYGNTSQRRNALDRMRGLGVEAVRATLLWRSIAPKNTARRKPRGFNGAHPATTRPDVGPLRRARRPRRRAAASPSTSTRRAPGPRWAHGNTRVQGSRRLETEPEGVRKFVRAAGRRYSGSYRDENNGRRVLPRVSWWGIWNEPNQPGWLTPQGEPRRGAGMVAAASHLYRELLVTGAKGLLASGHGDDLVLIGELAPIGSAKKADGPTSSLRPGLFLREMFCLNNRYRPFTARRRPRGAATRSTASASSSASPGSASATIRTRESAPRPSASASATC